jgi:hypothetical protein
MYNYNQYGGSSSTNNNSRSGSSGSRSSSRSDDMKLKLGPNTVIEGELVNVFGHEANWGQSLAVKLENVTLVDGCLYKDTEKEKFKTFSWEDVLGMPPSLDFEVSPGDANRFLAKSYGGTNKKYELVEARVQALMSEPEIPEGASQEEIDEILESFEPEEIRPASPAEPVEIAESIIMWYGGSKDYGPKSASKTLARTLTEGNVVVLDAEGKVNKDVFNWLADVTHDNLVRSDLEGRRLGLMEVTRPAFDPKTGEPNGRNFYHAVVIDAKTGEEVYPQAATESGTDENAAPEAAPVTDGGQSKAAVSDLPPRADTGGELTGHLAEFAETVTAVGYDSDDIESARSLLHDLIADRNDPITVELVDEFGGEDAVLAAALE